MRIFLVSLLILFTLPITSANAADDLFVMEIFTYPSCSPGELDTLYNPDGSVKDSNETQKKFNIKHIGSVFEEVSQEHPNAITLHYFNDQGYHTHDEDGADIPSETINQELATFFSEKSYIHYRNQTFLENSLNAQMVINGTYPIAGTMKHVANAAIKKSQNEHKIATAKLAINGQILNIELPEIQTDKAITPFLIGYQQRQKIDKARAPPAINPTNIVTSFKELTPWNGEGRSHAVETADMNANGFALIAQDKNTGKIYAAGKIELPIDQSSQ